MLKIGAIEMNINKKIAIAIDGPAAAGKSTVAKKVAEQLKYTYIDTGAMYRAVTYLALRQGVNLASEEALAKIVELIELELSHTENGQRVRVNGKDVTEEIRSDEVTQNVSEVAAHGVVREALVKQQRLMAEKRGVVMDGRDIGTQVIPDAEIKIFMIASVEERAERRYNENKAKGFEPDLDQLKDEIRKRDQHDQERIVSPLIKADDAIELDTTSMSIEQVTELILEIIQEKVK